MKSLWGGRFSGSLDEAAKNLNNSLPFDWRLWREDIHGSIAYATALEEAGVITEEERFAIVEGLDSIRLDLESGSVELDSSAEDVHTAVESLLAERIGAAAGKLHTGRSRNDQVATDTRLYLMRKIEETLAQVAGLQGTLLEIAEMEVDTILPGCTHLQHAQPVLLAHHVLAYFWMLDRDIQRLRDMLPRVRVLPLGSGALAGSTFPLNRERIAEMLGFHSVSPNSMDAVSDRDFAVEFLSCASILLMHLSRFAEEIVIWNTPEYRFIELDDSVTTGSSLMPQKKNPDLAELARAKPGRVYGHLIALLTVMKGLPLAYDKDLQEDKEGLFDTCDTLDVLLPAFERMLSTARFNRERMRESLKGDLSTATDLADFLVRDGIPFRAAHEIIGRLVRQCVDHGIGLGELAVEDLAAFHPSLRNAPIGWEAVIASLDARNIEGGTGPEAVKEQLARAKGRLGQPASVG